MSRKNAIIVLLVAFAFLAAFLVVLTSQRGSDRDVRLLFGAAGAVGYIAIVTYRWLRGDVL
jgi:hypothetical protein